MMHLSFDRHLGCVVTTAAALLISALILLTPHAAHAQQGCDAEALDTLASARRARSVLLARDLFERAHETEQRLVREWNDRFLAEHEAGDWQVYASWVGEVSEVSGYSACLDGMTPRDVGLAGGWNGFAIGAERARGPSLRLFYLSSGDSLSPDDFRPTDDVIVSDEAIGTGQSLYGVRVGWSHWAALTLGATHESRTRFDVSTSSDGNSSTLSSGSSVELLSGPGVRRLYVGLGVPIVGATLNLVVDPNASGLDYSFLGVERLPLDFWVPGLAVTAGGGTFRFEDQVLAQLGASYRLFDDMLVPSADVAFELNSPRLRSARLTARAKLWGATGFGDPDAPIDMSSPEAQAKAMEDALLRGILPWLGGAIGAHLELSLYNSAYLEQVTGRSMVPGVFGGGWFDLYTRWFTFGLEVFGGVNRQDTLTRLADAVDRSELGVKIHLRFGW